MLTLSLQYTNRLRCTDDSSVGSLSKDYSIVSAHVAIF